jgi:hypothetical protein
VAPETGILGQRRWTDDGRTGDEANGTTAPGRLGDPAGYAAVCALGESTFVDPLLRWFWLLCG